MSKVIDTRAYVSLLREEVEQGREVGMRIAGNSMSPFLVHQRDDIFFKKPESPLNKGDMVFYQRKNGQYVMHRICRVRPEGLYIVGDAQTAIEGPVLPEQVFARVTQVRRKGNLIGPESFWWKFFGKVWICMIPLRPAAMKLYSLVRKHK